MQTRKFRYLPHMADVAFEAYGSSFKALVENAAAALLGVMFDVKKIRKEKRQYKTLGITEHAQSREDLLWFTLQKIVSRVDEKGANAFSFRVNRIKKSGKDLALNGCLFYKHMKSYSALLDVKGVTPHTLELKHTGKGYRARVLVDV